MGISSHAVRSNRSGNCMGFAMSGGRQMRHCETSPSYSISAIRGAGTGAARKSNQDLRALRINWLNEGFPSHTLNQMLKERSQGLTLRCDV